MWATFDSHAIGVWFTAAAARRMRFKVCFLIRCEDYALWLISARRTRLSACFAERTLVIDGCVAIGKALARTPSAVASATYNTPAMSTSCVVVAAVGTGLPAEGKAAIPKPYVAEVLVRIAIAIADAVSAEDTLLSAAVTLSNESSA